MREFPWVPILSSCLAGAVVLSLGGIVTVISDRASYGARLTSLEGNVEKLQGITQGLDGHFGPDGNMAIELKALHEQQATTLTLVRNLNAYLNRGSK